MNQMLDEDDLELIKHIEPLYQKELSRARQEGWQQGWQQGRQQGQRLMVENVLRVRFGLLDERLSVIIDRLLSLPPEEFTSLLLSESREELLARFGQHSS